MTPELPFPQMPALLRYAPVRLRDGLWRVGFSPLCVEDLGHPTAGPLSSVRLQPFFSAFSDDLVQLAACHHMSPHRHSTTCEWHLDASADEVEHINIQRVMLLCILPPREDPLAPGTWFDPDAPYLGRVGTIYLASCALGHRAPAYAGPRLLARWHGNATQKFLAELEAAPWEWEDAQ